MNDKRRTMNGRRTSRFLPFSIQHFRQGGFIVILSLCLCVSAVETAVAQLETIDNSTPAAVSYIGHGQIEGHLALQY